jgi:hypothetical protein
MRRRPDRTNQAGAPDLATQVTASGSFSETWFAGLRRNSFAGFLGRTVHRMSAYEGTGDQGIPESAQPAYSMLAKAAAKQRQNLLISVAQAPSMLDVAKWEFDQVTTELSDLETIHNN